MAAHDANASVAPLIELVGVSISSAQEPDVALVEGVDWRLLPGDFWVVGGLHWTGKSDWLTTVAGLQRPAAGAQGCAGVLALVARVPGGSPEPILRALPQKASPRHVTLSPPQAGEGSRWRGHLCGVGSARDSSSRSLP